MAGRVLYGNGSLPALLTADSCHTEAECPITWQTVLLFLRLFFKCTLAGSHVNLFYGLHSAPLINWWSLCFPVMMSMPFFRGLHRYRAARCYWVPHRTSTHLSGFHLKSTETIWSKSLTTSMLQIWWRSLRPHLCLSTGLDNCHEALAIHVSVTT